MEPVTVRQLIKHLKSCPQDILVIYKLHSEHKLLELDEVRIKELQPARPDGWVHDFWHGEPKLTSVKYLILPGN